MTETIAIPWDDQGSYFSVEKPAGLPVFPPHADRSGDCVLRRLLVARPHQAGEDWPFGFEGGIAHRLDNSTSGQLIVCRSPRALSVLRGHFQSRVLVKRYVFVTAKDVPWSAHEVDRPLAHDKRRKGRMISQRGMNTPHRGRWLDARTVLQRLGEVREGLWAWQAEMSTGVMHQIRVHAATVGLALAGDRRYGGGPVSVPRPEGVEFLLHHAGLQGPDLNPVPVAPPSWWPRVLALVSAP